MASWRSGYAEDCKSLHPGSIPGEASNHNQTSVGPRVVTRMRGDEWRYQGSRAIGRTLTPPSVDSR